MPPLPPPLLLLLLLLLPPPSQPSPAAYSTPVHSPNGTLLGTCHIPPDVEPADAAYAFVTSHNLGSEYKNAILEAACQSLECFRAEAVVARATVQVGGEGLEVEVYEGEDAGEVASAFAREHRLAPETARRLRESLLPARPGGDWGGDWAPSSPPGGPPAYTALLTLPSGPASLPFPPGEEPADVAYAFTSARGLDESWYTAILEDACSHVACARVEPAVFSIPVDLGARVETLAILQHLPGRRSPFTELEPLDQILDFCDEHGVPDAGVAVLVGEVRAAGIEVDEYVPTQLLFSQSVVLEEPLGNLGVLEVFEGEEPADAVYDFLWGEPGAALAEVQRERVLASLLDHVCAAAPCSRREPCVWSDDVLAPTGAYVGTVEIMKGVEPADAVYHFADHFGLDGSYSEAILAAACEDLECRRASPRAFTQQVAGEGGGAVGTVDILRGEEVIDGVVRFLRENPDFQVDEPALKNHFFNTVCGTPHTMCTRNVALLYEKEIQGPEGESYGKLTVMENEEPVDKIWLFLAESIAGEAERANVFYQLKASVCAHPMVRCNRDAPLVFGPQPISGPGGDHVGNLEVLLGEEPIDATYKFFARYDLFAKDWNLKEVFEQVCKLEGLEGRCRRRVALKYVNEDMQIGGINKTVGRVIVWEDQEVVDVLYEKKMEHNLTQQEMYALFYDICNKPDVYCGRNRAVAARRRPNKEDYPKTAEHDRVGNSTCVRQYCGWRYIAGWNMPKKEEFIQWLHSAETKSVYSNERFAWHFFCCCVLAIRLTVAALLRLPPLKKLHLKEKMRKSRIGHIRWWALHLASGFLLASWLWVYSVEPSDHIDSAMHEFTGKMPIEKGGFFDVEVLDGQEVADAVLLWAKAAEKEHHPLLRKPIYWSLIDELCEELPHQCSRKKAHVQMNFGSIGLWGQTHEIFHWKNPNASMEEEVEAGLMEALAAETCDRLVPMPPNCVEDLTIHTRDQYKNVEHHRLKKKNMYVKLSIANDASAGEVYSAAGRSLNRLGENWSPFARVDNGTAMHHKWDDAVGYGHSVKDKVWDLLVEKDREWYDKPCEPVFGGAMCAKKDAAGNMNIEMGGGDEE